MALSVRSKLLLVAPLYLSRTTASFLVPFGKASRFSSTLVKATNEKGSMSSITTSLVEIDKPEDVNVVVGMTHFIKTVDDIHEALVGVVPGIKFGLGFCEASGDRLVRWTGTDDDLIELAKKNAQNLACGHSFCLFLGPPCYPIHILNTLKMVPEVCRILCATQNKLEIIVAESPSGRGIMGVIDGQTPVGVETEENIEERKSFLKTIGYKV